MNQSRQGDLLIVGVQDFPGKRVIKRWLDNPNEFVVLKGEATGHSHRLIKKDRDFLEVFENEKGDRFFEVRGQVELVHEEHDTIKFSSGKYAIVRQRAYTPQAIHYVVD